MGDDVYDCPTCERSFDTKVGVKVHHKRSHGESIAGVDAECEWCGRKYTVAPHEEGSTRFCSMKCKGKYIGDLYEGEDHPHYSKRTELKCEWCGEIYKRIPSEVDGSRFCSASCRSSWVGDNQNKNRRKLQCEQCRSEYYRIPSEATNSRYCSRQCQNLAMRDTHAGERNPQWRGGRRPYGKGWTESKRRRVRLRDQARCQICGRTEAEHIEQHGRKHDVHHITPAREIDDPEQRNATENLLTVCCGECHATAEKVAPLRPDTGATAD